jgi:palmitoyltransferase
MPLLSQGFKVCIHPPLTDEPRIALQIGDIVNVTRWRKHWLFGEKVVDEQENNNKENGKKSLANETKLEARERVRGWFPRQCAAEFLDDNDDGVLDEEPNDSKKQK